MTERERHPPQNGAGIPKPKGAEESTSSAVPAGMNRIAERITEETI